MESNYSFALMILLKYPSPGAPNGPRSFVDDAIFLRDNLNEAGGAQIIRKYSGKAPPTPSVNSRPQTPLDQSASPTRNLYRAKSPLASPARFLQQQGGVEALLQGAAKGVFDRGERLGINQAVRNAVGEVKKNMQDLQASRSNSYKGRSSDGMKWSLDEGKVVPSGRAVIAKMNDRNSQLARMLEQAMNDLRKVSVLPNEEKGVYIAAMDLAIAKVDFVKVYLEDATIPLVNGPSEIESTSDPLPAAVPPPKIIDPLEARSTDPQSTSAVTSPELAVRDSTSTLPTRLEQVILADDSSTAKSISATKQISEEILLDPDPSIIINQSSASRAESPVRPSAPVPTRSSIAQSSFSWMLEPDTPSFSSSQPNSSSPFLKSSRKPTSGPNRERAAFLFGEDEGEAILPSARPPPLRDAEEGFNMSTMRGSSTK
jgi:TBC1 domain family protein 5